MRDSWEQIYRASPGENVSRPYTASKKKIGCETSLFAESIWLIRGSTFLINCECPVRIRSDLLEFTNRCTRTTLHRCLWIPLHNAPSIATLQNSSSVAPDARFSRYVERNSAQIVLGVNLTCVRVCMLMEVVVLGISLVNLK